MVFAICNRGGRLAKDGQPIQSQTVEDALCAIGQTVASLGSKGYRLISAWQVKYCLSQQLKNYKNIEPEPSQVKPVPISVLCMATVRARQSNDTFAITVADMSTIGFYYLCHPGEHALSAEGSHSAPFCLCDVTFRHGARALDTLLVPFAQLHASTFALLTYTNQKNAVRGETIGHGCMQDPYLGPVKALAH